MKKIISTENLAKIISKFKKKGKRVVLCHGVFDLLHIGHINHFKEAKKLGDILVVTVTQDKYVNKGPNRPIFSLNTRMELIAALKDIDYVAPNIYSNAIQLIKMLKPSIYCKGKDYKNYNLDATNQIKKEVLAIKSVGGRIIHTDTELFSSSKIINQTNLDLTNEQKSLINKIKKNKNFNNDSKILSTMNSFSDIKVLIIGETIIDEYVYEKALENIAEFPHPFITTILTLSNHHPWDSPLENIAALPENTENRNRRNTFRYTDWALHHFISEVKNAELYDNTIFIILADHGQYLYNDYDIEPRNFRIPLLILNSGMEPHINHTLGSQIDIIPTVLDLLGENGKISSFGRSLLKENIENDGSPNATHIVGKVLLSCSFPLITEALVVL